VRAAIDSPKNISVQVVTGASDVLIDSFYTSEIDIRDLSTLGSENPPGKAAPIAAFLSEQRIRLERGIPATIEGHRMIHPFSGRAIRNVSGYSRISSDISQFTLATQSGTIVTTFQKGNSVVTVTIQSQNGEVTSVMRQ